MSIEFYNSNKKILSFVLKLAKQKDDDWDKDSLPFSVLNAEALLGLQYIINEDEYYPLGSETKIKISNMINELMKEFIELYNKNRFYENFNDCLSLHRIPMSNIISSMKSKDEKNKKECQDIVDNILYTIEGRCLFVLCFYDDNKMESFYKDIE